MPDLAGESEGEARPSDGGKPKKKASEKKADPVGIPEPHVTDAKLIPVTAIKSKAHQTNTREKLSDADLEDIQPSVANLGVIVPIHVEDNGDGSYTLISGNRRLAAAKKVGVKNIPAVVVDMKVANAAAVSAVENLVRKNLDQVEEAKAYDILIKAFKINQADVAKIVGKSPTHVSRMLAVLGTSKKTQKKIAKGKMSERDVRGKTKRSAGQPGPKPGAKTKLITIPVEDLPKGVTLSIKESFDVSYAKALGVPRQTATVTMKFDLNSKVKTVAAVTKVVKRQVEAVIKAMTAKRIDSAYKTIREV